MNKKSTFQINDTFKVTGRGIVLAGNISAGSVSVGDYLEFDFINKIVRKRILAIEEIRSSKAETNCGLVIETQNENEIEELNNWEPKGIRATVCRQISNQ